MGKSSPLLSDSVSNEATSEVSKSTSETPSENSSKKASKRITFKKPSPEVVVIEPQAPTAWQGTKRKVSELPQEQGATPLKRRLRPRKPPVEPEVVITEVRPSTKSRKPTPAAKKKPTTTRKPTRRGKIPKEEPQIDAEEKPAINARASVEVQDVKPKRKQTRLKLTNNSKTAIEIPSTDEE